jgi:hypothetical protein
MKFSKTCIIALLLLAFNAAKTQNIEEEITKQLEAIAGENELNDESEIESGFIYLQNHPLNINTATTEDWQVFPFISEIQIKSLEKYKQLFGKLISIYELQAVPLWNIDMLTKLQPFITVKETFDAFKWNNLFMGQHSFLIRENRVLEKQKGYTKINNGFQGSPDQLLLRYRYRFRKLIDAGFTFEKDAGEPFFNKGIKGFDFASFHILARSKALVKLIAAGDFTINLGQGLIQWQSLAFHKSGLATAIKRQGDVLQPYTSSAEFNFHRGLAVCLKRKAIEACFFLSSQKQSATVSPDSVEESLSNFYTSGLHRTANEISKRNAVHYYSAGGCILYKAESFMAGINGVVHSFSSPIAAGDKPYNKFSATGTSLSDISINYAATPGRLHFFGEAAIGNNLSKAFINGLLLAPHRNLDLAFLYRNIQPGYQSLNGNAFTENSSPVNENGFYFGLTLRPVDGWQLDAYSDFFRFPWLKYRVDRPSGGTDYLLQLTWKPSRQWDIYTRLKTKTKELNGTGDFITHTILNTTRTSWKIYIRNDISPSIEIKSSVEMVWYKEQQSVMEEGFLGFIETSAKVSNRLSGNIRITCFETTGFNSRVYTYESGLPFSSQIPFFNGNGSRIYLNARVAIFKDCLIAARLARTIFYDKSLIGTGLDSISKNHKTTLGIQFQCAF